MNIHFNCVLAAIVASLIAGGCGGDKPASKPAPPPAPVEPEINPVGSGEFGLEPRPVPKGPTVENAGLAQFDKSMPAASKRKTWPELGDTDKSIIMEGWLQAYSEGDEAAKAQIVNQIRSLPLTPKDRAMLEETRARYALPKIPL